MATAFATRRVASANACASRWPTAQIFGRCAFGTTSVWPSTAGTSGRKAKTSLVRNTSRAGARPATIAQKGHSRGGLSASTTISQRSADVQPVVAHQATLLKDAQRTYGLDPRTPVAALSRSRDDPDCLDRCSCRCRLAKLSITRHSSRLILRRLAVRSRPRSGTEPPVQRLLGRRSSARVRRSEGRTQRLRARCARSRSWD